MKGYDCEDSLIDETIKGVEDWAEGYCRRIFGRNDYLATTNSLSCLSLPNSPVSDIIVTYLADGDTSYTTIPDTEYQIDYSELDPKIVFNSDFEYPTLADKLDSVKITYKGGFTIATAPYDLKQAIKFRVATYYENRVDQNKVLFRTAEELLTRYKTYLIG